MRMFINYVIWKLFQISPSRNIRTFSSYFYKLCFSSTKHEWFVSMKSFLTCIGEFPLSTLSIPSLLAPPPNKAVTIFSPTEIMLAHGDVGASPLSMSSDFVGMPCPPALAPLKNICMTMPNRETRTVSVDKFQRYLIWFRSHHLTCWTMRIRCLKSGWFEYHRRCHLMRLSSKRSTFRRTFVPHQAVARKEWICSVAVVDEMRFAAVGTVVGRRKSSVSNGSSRAWTATIPWLVFDSSFFELPRNGNNILVNSENLHQRGISSVQFLSR